MGKARLHGPTASHHQCTQARAKQSLTAGSPDIMTMFFNLIHGHAGVTFKVIRRLDQV